MPKNLTFNSKSGSVATVIFAVLAILGLFGIIAVLALQYLEREHYDQHPSTWHKPGMGAPGLRPISSEAGPAPAPAPAAPGQ